MAKDRIVMVLHPFDKDQTIMVYQKGNKINAETVTIDDIPNITLKFSKMYDINNIGIIGPKKFCEKIGEHIRQAELTKYNTNTLNIEVLR